MNKRLMVLFFVFSLFFCFRVFSLDWQETKGDHFIVYSSTDQSRFAKDVLNFAEKYYREIAKDLGYQRYSEFWLWDKRVKIYIYPDHASYLKVSNMPSWSHGMADYTNKEVLSYVRGEGFLESILPHEIAHLLFRDFVGFTGEIPLWLDEGVAQWAEKKKRPYFKRLMKQAMENRRFLSLEDMMSLNLRGVKDDDDIYIRATVKDKEPVVLFITGKNLVNLYYLEAVSLVGFLVERYGGIKFTSFCRELRDGKSVEEALKVAYPHAVKNLEILQEEWIEYVETQ